MFSRTQVASPEILNKDSGSEKVGFKRGATGATSRKVNAKLEEFISILDFGGVADSSTDNTTALQAAIDSLPDDGGTVKIPHGCYFNLKSIDGSLKQYNLEYWARDERDAIGDGSNPGTNEYIHWSNNWKQDGGGTTDVNEWRFQAPYHPGIVLNNRENIAHSGSGNDNAGQCSIVMKKNNFNQWQFQQGFLGTTGVESPGEGYVYNRNYYAVSSYDVHYTLAIGTTHFAVLTPAAGDMVEGATSGAKGRVRSASASTLNISWLHGEFIDDEDLILSQYTQISSSEYTVATDTSTTGIGTVPASTYSAATFRMAMALDGVGVGINTPVNRIVAGQTIGGPLLLENAQGGGYGSAVPSIRVVDDQNFPKKGFKFDIDPTTGGLRLLDHNGSAIGTTSEGVITGVEVADAETGGVSVTPPQAGYFKRSMGVVNFTIGLLNINTAGMTTGNTIYIRGLPYSSRSGGNNQSLVNVKGQGITSTTGSIGAEVIAASDVMKIYQNTTTGSSDLTIAAIASGSGDLFISGSYLE